MTALKAGDRVSVAAFEGTVEYVNMSGRPDILPDGPGRTVEYVPLDLVTKIESPIKVGDTVLGGDLARLDREGTLIRGAVSGTYYTRGTSPRWYATASGVGRHLMAGEYVVLYIPTAPDADDEF